MRLTSLLVPIFSAVVVADSSWSWFREDSAIDNLENPYFFSAPETLSAQTDSLPISNRIESTDLAKSKSVFTPDCEGFEYTLCCTGVQTKDWNEMDGVFYSITDCKKRTFFLPQHTHTLPPPPKKKKERHVLDGKPMRKTAVSEAKDCHPENWYCCHQFLVSTFVLCTL